MKNIFISKTAKWISLCCFCFVSNLLLAQIVQKDMGYEVIEDSALVTIEVYDSYTGYPIQAKAQVGNQTFQCNELGRVSVYCKVRKCVDFVAEGYSDRGYCLSKDEEVNKNEVIRLDMYPISKQQINLTSP